MAEKLNLASSQAARPVPFSKPKGTPNTDRASFLASWPAWDEEHPELHSASQCAAWLESGQAILDVNGCVIAFNEALTEWLEQPSGRVIGLCFWNLLAERCRQWQEPLAALRRKSGTFVETQLQLSTGESPDQTWYRLELTRHATGALVRLHSILPPLAALEEATWDEYLRTESAQRGVFIRLLRAESQLKNLTERWPGVIFSQRADLTFRFVSPQIELLTGVSVADWQAQPHLFWRVVHESDAEELRQQLRQGQQSRQAFTSTYRVRNLQTGRIAYVMEHRQPNISGSGLTLGYEGVWLDVTRQTIAEKRLSSTVWKETLSVLTMGLAHDFGNVMAGIHALSESFLDQIGPTHDFKEGLELIKGNAQTASQLVHRIINLHQGKPGQRDYYNLNEVVADLGDLVRKILPRRMQFAVELSAEALPVYLDAIELRQVVINLVLNAVDSMPQAGRLVLRTSGHATFPPVGNLQGDPPRLPAACLSVQDAGGGIKERHLASIFDPFFTTKAMNKGSGLGLYNARLFVEKHRGAISVDTREFVGSTFHLWLPQADFSENEVAATTAVGVGRRSLLVVGQAGETLDGTVEFLRINGYQVVLAASTEQAREALRSNNYSFNGVMLLADPHDRALPALVSETRQYQPQSRLILTAIGHNQDELPPDLINDVDMLIPADLPRSRILEKLAKDI